MKKRVIISAVAGVMLTFAGPAATPSQGSVTIIDFNAVALRPANDGVSGYGTIT